MQLDIEQNVFTIVDFESTALEITHQNRLVEIGAIKTQAGKTIDKFYSLVNPEVPISVDAYRIHRISDEMIADKPVFKDLATPLLNFIDGTILVAHNTFFDVRILNSELDRVGFEKYKMPSIDTVRLARRAFNELKRHNLDALINYLGINTTGRHRSMGDCEATIVVFWECIKRLREKGKLKDMIDLLRFGKNSKLAEELGLQIS